MLQVLLKTLVEVQNLMMEPRLILILAIDAVITKEFNNRKLSVFSALAEFLS